MIQCEVYVVPSLMATLPSALPTIQLIVDSVTIQECLSRAELLYQDIVVLLNTLSKLIQPPASRHSPPR
jgi:hypothetical protein